MNAADVSVGIKSSKVDLELSLEDARRLYEELKQLFDRPNTYPYYPYPINPYAPYSERMWDYKVWCSNGTGDDH